jgi:subtilisin-like proprotein convertase family protein
MVLYPSGRNHNQFTRRILTRDVLLHTTSSADVQRLAQENGATVTRAFPYLANHYLLTATDPVGALSLAQNLRDRPGVISAEPQLASLAQKRLLPTDTLFTNQWHLLNTGQNGASNGIDINVTNIWETWRGTNIYIAIVDDGLQYTHPDLAPNSDTNIDYDFNDNDADPDPDPRNWDFHGTAVAGLAAARGNNGLGVCGAAYEATLVGLRLIAYPATDADNAAAMSHSNSVIHIKNNSWGPPDCPFDGTALEAPGPLMQAALADGVTTGRGGKGVIYTWACGNGQQCGENVNYDGFANSINAFAIGAVGYQGQQVDYSEPGACLVVCAPSGDGQGVTTTDLVGEDGYNSFGMGDLSDNNYTKQFSGTSSSAPLAAGVIALMLQANPNLSYRDVKEILLRSSTKVQPDDGDWATNSAGIPHNHKFGAGLISAQGAVILATNWCNLDPLTNISMLETNLSLSIPDNDSNGVSRTFSLSGLNFRVEHVSLTLTAPHQNWGNLAVTLTSPSGMTSRLAEPHAPVDTSYGYQGWTFTSVRHWGENANGTWTVTVADESSGDTGTLEAVELKLYGTLPQARLAVCKTNQNLQIQITAAAPSWTYAIEASDDFASWTSISTQAILACGHFDFTDYNTPGSNQRFYRAKLLP